MTLISENPEPAPLPELPLAKMSRRQICIETCVVMLLAIIPDIYNALQSVFVGSSGYSPTYLLTAGSVSVRALQVSAPMLYLIWRSDLGLDGFGLRRFRLLPDLCGGIATYLVGYLGYVIIWRILWTTLPNKLYRAIYYSGHHYTFATPSHGGEHIVLVISSLLNGFAEEIVMRAYLITRLMQLSKSRSLPVIVSSLLFASYHAYQGWTGIISAMILGFVYGVIFSRCRRLWPVAIAHALSDIVAFLMLEFR